MTDTKPRLAVLMLSWLRFEGLLKTVKQLPSTCSEPLHLILRVQGLENLTKKDRDKVCEAASEFATTDIYFTPYNIGTAAARLDLTHRGAKAGYPYLMFTDDDIKFSKHGIDRQVEVLDNNPVIGSVSLRPDNKRFLRTISGNSILAVDRRGLKDLFYKVFMVGSASMMFRSILYKKHLVAPDPEYYIGYWDFDFAIQVQQAGYEVTEIPNYTIRNRKGGCKEYVARRRRKAYINCARTISVRKWGFDIVNLYSRVLKVGKVKLPIIGKI